MKPVTFELDVHLPMTKRLEELHRIIYAVETAIELTTEAKEKESEDKTVTTESTTVSGTAAGGTAIVTVNSQPETQHLDAIDWLDIMKGTVNKSNYKNIVYPIAIPFDLGFRYDRMKYNPITEILFVYIPGDSLDDDDFIKNLVDYENTKIIRPVTHEEADQIISNYYGGD
jgi:hypothetical protein